MPDHFYYHLVSTGDKSKQSRNNLIEKVKWKKSVLLVTLFTYRERTGLGIYKTNAKHHLWLTTNVYPLPLSFKTNKTTKKNNLKSFARNRPRQGNHVEHTPAQERFLLRCPQHVLP